MDSPKNPAEREFDSHFSDAELDKIADLPVKAGTSRPIPNATHDKVMPDKRIAEKIYGEIRERVQTIVYLSAFPNEHVVTYRIYADAPTTKGAKSYACVVRLIPEVVSRRLDKEEDRRAKEFDDAVIKNSEALKIDVAQDFKEIQELHLNNCRTKYETFNLEKQNFGGYTAGPGCGVDFEKETCEDLRDCLENLLPSRTPQARRPKEFALCVPRKPLKAPSTKTVLPKAPPAR